MHGLEGMEHPGELAAGRRITLKWTLKEYDLKIWNALIWLRLGFSEGSIMDLWIPYCQGSLSLVERIFSSQEGFCRIEFSLPTYIHTYTYILLLLLWLYITLLGLGRFLSFLILYTVGRTPWNGDQPVARHLHNHRINAHNKDTHALSRIRTHDPSVPRK
jgi:hypothetical protein